MFFHGEHHPMCLCRQSISFQWDILLGTVEARLPFTCIYDCLFKMAGSTGRSASCHPSCSESWNLCCATWQVKAHLSWDASAEHRVHSPHRKSIWVFRQNHYRARQLNCNGCADIVQLRLGLGQSTIQKPLSLLLSHQQLRWC